MSGPIDDAWDALPPQEEIGEATYDPTPEATALRSLFGTHAFRQLGNAGIDSYSGRDLEVATAIQEHIARNYLFARQAHRSKPTDELGQLRKRVAELEAVAGAAQVLADAVAAGPPVLRYEDCGALRELGLALARAASAVLETVPLLALDPAQARRQFLLPFLMEAFWAGAAYEREHPEHSIGEGNHASLERIAEILDRLVPGTGNSAGNSAAGPVPTGDPDR